MNQTIYSYQFGQDIPIDAVKDSLLLAVMAVEGLKGRTRVQLEARFRLNRSERSCVIEADTDVGESIARIFTGFLGKQFAEKTFEVVRMASPARALPPSQDCEASQPNPLNHAEAS